MFFNTRPSERIALDAPQLGSELEKCFIWLMIMSINIVPAPLLKEYLNGKWHSYCVLLFCYMCNKLKTYCFGTGFSFFYCRLFPEPRGITAWHIEQLFNEHIQFYKKNDIYLERWSGLQLDWFYNICRLNRSCSDLLWYWDTPKNTVHLTTTLPNIFFVGNYHEQLYPNKMFRYHSVQTAISYYHSPASKSTKKRLETPIFLWSTITWLQ
jgi:hypothetical protein